MVLDAIEKGISPLLMRKSGLDSVYFDPGQNPSSKTTYLDDLLDEALDEIPWFVGITKPIVQFPCKNPQGQNGEDEESIFFRQHL